MPSLLSRLLGSAERPVAELLEKAGYSAEDAFRGLTRAAEIPEVRNFALTLDPTSFDYASAIRNKRIMDAAEYIANEGLPISPWFRAWNGQNKVIDQTITPVQTTMGAPIVMPNLVQHGSWLKGHKVLESGHSRYKEGDTGIWGAMDKGATERARSYAYTGPDNMPANGEVIPLWVRLENPFITDAGNRSWDNISLSEVINYAGLKQPVKYDKATNKKMAQLLQDYHDKEIEYGNALADLRKPMKLALDNATKGSDIYRKFSGDPGGLIYFAQNGDVNSPLFTNKEALAEYRQLVDKHNELKNKYNESINNLDDVAKNYFLYSDPTIESTLHNNFVNPNLSKTYEVVGELKKKYGDTIDGTIMRNIADGGGAGNYATNITWNTPVQAKHATENNNLFNPSDDRLRYGFLAAPTASLDTGYTKEADVNPVESFALGAFPPFVAGLRTGNPYAALLGGAVGGTAGLAGDYTLTELLNALSEAQQDPSWDFDVPPETYNGAI